jgi:hypothetical protein
MNSGRNCSIIVIIPAPETPPRINKGGNQHQLDAMNADSNAPKLANRSLRFAAIPSPLVEASVAPGDLGCFGVQQSAAGVGTGNVSSGMIGPR